ncbi:dephospho-CoA kinase [Williamsoniiplasma luminosum]|uniref:Dephospho-CoA kinase n=1 Tax=Williamsoniiplasma luminosum TaxID=214888 RepID=A0A2S0NJE0_9MOLU|nr:dephospho-CoA kinase [Williamsoniiplasma luminosum]AVP49129.1 MAG: dephospho-CoA kinase [Williamsoniiplasma luminosum]
MILGIFGFTGSGKTTVTKYITEKYNFKAIDLDVISREIMDLEESQNFVKMTFPQAYNMQTQKVDRKILREIIFNSPIENQKLSQYMWPKIKEHVIQTITSSKENIIIDGAILPKLNIPVDKYIYVSADQQDLLHRIKVRDNANENTTYELLKYQGELLYESVKDFEIHNNSSIEKLYQQIEIIMKKIKD